MNRLTPSMCQVPSGCRSALVRPRRRRSRRPARSAPSSRSTCARPPARRTAAAPGCPCATAPGRTTAPLAYIQTAGLAPRISSATAQHSDRGASVPPSSAGSSSRNHSASMKGLEGLLEGLGHPDRRGRRVEDRRVAVSLGERLGDRTGGQPVDLVQDPARGLLVELGIRLRAQQVLPAQHLEQVELDVTEVALVVTHRGLPVRSQRMLLASNKRSYYQRVTRARARRRCRRVVGPSGQRSGRMLTARAITRTPTQERHGGLHEPSSAWPSGPAAARRSG